MKAIPILIAGIFARCRSDGLVAIAPGFQASVDGIFVGEKQPAYLNRLLENGLDGALLNIRQPVETYLTATLDHPNEGRFFALHGATSWFPFEPSAAPWTVQFRHPCGMTFRPGDTVACIPFDLAAQLDRLFLRAIPARNGVVMSCTASLARANSAAIG
jgi:hypothetical protein